MATAQMMRVCGSSGQQQGLVGPRQGGLRALQSPHLPSRSSLRKNQQQLRRTPLCRQAPCGTHHCNCFSANRVYECRWTGAWPSPILNGSASCIGGLQVVH
eukprot:scaffold41067_cov18-Tisochrysis_lutea.AAC.2